MIKYFFKLIFKINNLDFYKINIINIFLCMNNIHQQIKLIF